MDLTATISEKKETKDDEEATIIVVNLESQNPEAPAVSINNSDDCTSEVQSSVNKTVHQGSTTNNFESNKQTSLRSFDDFLMKIDSAEESNIDQLQNKKFDNFMLENSHMDIVSTTSENNRPTPPETCTSKNSTNLSRDTNILESLLTSQSLFNSSIIIGNAVTNQNTPESMIIDEEDSRNYSFQGIGNYTKSDEENPICNNITIEQSEAGPSLVIDGTKPSQLSGSLALNMQDLVSLPIIIDGAIASSTDQHFDGHSVNGATMQNTIESSTSFKDYDFAVPSTSRYFPKEVLNNSENCEQSKVQDATDNLPAEQSVSNLENGNNSVMIGSELFKVNKINIYTEDKGPKFYDVSGNFVTPPLITKNLTEAFSFLPIFGRPKNQESLGEFQMNKIRDFVGGDLNDQEFELLSDYCSPEHLRTGKELVMDSSSPGLGFFPLDKNLSINVNPGLNIHRKLKLRIEKDIRNNYMKRMKYRGIHMIPLNTEEDETPAVTIGEPLHPGKDLLFRIRVYRPFTYSPNNKYLNRTRHSVFSIDILMLGRQKLSVLRDRIMCCNDVDMRVDVSERPDDHSVATAKEVFPSGFLFINNVFYVDSRPGCSDRSAALRHWAAARGLGDFPVRDLCSFQLDDVVIKLGHPDVYVHQGNCEHLFIFSEVRLLNAGDPLRPSAYPRHTAISQNQTIYCTTCAEFAAKWIVVGCASVPFDPAFFCDKCFKMYMYKDGRKRGDFKAYLYRGNEIK